MNANGSSRRARPLLGTLVEVGVVDGAGRGAARLGPAIDAAFARIAAVQAALSRFERDSDIGRFNAAPAGTCLAIGSDAQRVLSAAQTLRDLSSGRFDISLGSGVDAWHCDGAALHKRSAAVRLDLGGIAKGYAVDAGIEALRAAGAAAGWVNAGGDLRVFGAASLPIDLRDEVERRRAPFRLDRGRRVRDQPDRRRARPAASRQRRRAAVPLGRRAHQDRRPRCRRPTSPARPLRRCRLAARIVRAGARARARMKAP